MIRAQRQLFYFVGDTPYPSLETAQKADLISLMDWDATGEPKETLAAWMLKNSAAIVDTLTTTTRSRLKSRKLHGATRKPRSKKQPEPAVS